MLTWSNMEYCCDSSLITCFYTLQYHILLSKRLFKRCATNSCKFRVSSRSTDTPPTSKLTKNLHFGGIWVCLLNLGVLFEGTKRVKVWHVCLDFFAREHNFKNLAHTIDCGFPSLKILEVDCYKISHAKLTQFFNLAAEKWWVKLGIGVRCVWQKLPLECSKTHTVKQLGSPGRGFPP